MLQCTCTEIDYDKSACMKQNHENSVPVDPQTQVHPPSEVW